MSGMVFVTLLCYRLLRYVLTIVVCLNFGVVYGVGVCVNVCGVFCVVVCCLFLTSGCWLCCSVVGVWVICVVVGVPLWVEYVFRRADVVCLYLLYTQFLF